MHLTSVITRCLVGGTLGVMTGLIIAGITDNRPYYTIGMQIADNHKLMIQEWCELKDEIVKALSDPRYKQYHKELERDKASIDKHISSLLLGVRPVVFDPFMDPIGSTFNPITLKLYIRPQEQ